ncbi:MAG: signal peptide peptidase SppA [Gemmatimonadaceae bacterium]|nr:signal peptide peptidase SppA [Gemmatimonadaceae bacterium]
MKAFFTALAANLITIAICVVAGVLLLAGIIASAGSSAAPDVPANAVLVIDLDRPLSDRPAKPTETGFLDDAFAPGTPAIPLRSALTAIKSAGDDDRISGILLRGTVASDGTMSGFAALRELRAALTAFRTTSKKPVHAYLVTPDTRTYYVASAAGTITLDPFGSLLLPGLASEQTFLSGLFEQLGVGVQVSRVGRFKAAVEPFIRKDMSPENRLQTASYLGDLWHEVKRGIGESRGVDTVALQSLVDSAGIIDPALATSSKLVDRVAYFDAVLTDLEKMTGSSDSTKSTKQKSDMDELLGRPSLPQIALQTYASIAAAKDHDFTASQAVAVVYAEGDIVDGEGSDGSIGGDALARELRKLRKDDKVKAVVLRVNSPGGSAVASETMHRELTLLGAKKPLVVSMGSLAASGGYWISTAGQRVYAEPNTITGSIGVFSIVPNVQALANKHGVTFDTVKTGRYADLFTLSRPRTADEMAVLQRGTDIVYKAFLERVAAARKLPVDSVAAIAEGRVWSGVQAQRIGLVDSLGGLDAAVSGAAKLAKITGSFDVREYPRTKSARERLSEYFEDKPAPVASRAAQAVDALGMRGPAAQLARDITRELAVLLSYNDPRGTYARLPYILRVH